MTDTALPTDPSSHQVDSLLRVFSGGISAAQIAEPLRSFESSTPTAELVEVMRRRGLGVVGLRHEGLVAGYFEISEGGQEATEATQQLGPLPGHHYDGLGSDLEPVGKPRGDFERSFAGGRD